MKEKKKKTTIEKIRNIKKRKTDALAIICEEIVMENSKKCKTRKLSEEA